MHPRPALLRLAVGVLLVLIGWQLGIVHERSAKRVRIGSTDDAILLTPGDSSSGVTVRNPRRDVDMSLVWDVWDELIDHYIEPQKLQVTPLVYGAAEGLVRSVGDPYTVFMTPKESKEFEDGLAGNLEGIGAELTVRDGLIMIVTPIKGSPAERAGLRPKDVIQKVDGMSTEEWSLHQVVSRIRGPKGTVVKLTIGRENAGSLTFSITRDAIHIPSVEAKRIQRSGTTIGYVALNQFGENSIAELRKELQSFAKDGVFGVILDLRNNGGGYLEGAVELTSIFLRQGTVVSVQHRQGPGEALSVSGKALLPDTPLVVLQNEATASASEIVSGALQDHGRATVIGTKSFGKGTVQEVVDLGGASLRVTVARWLTPKGRNLGKEGVHPDITVDMPKQDPAEGQTSTVGEKPDPQLDAAVEALLKRR